ncbi:MAG: DUF58 domain-containing protein [Pseudomonadota bacterium]
MLDPDALMRLRFLATDRAASGAATALPGGHVTKRRGRGLETAEIRPFTQGDDPRHLDRNATARTGQLHTRTHMAERDRTTMLIADFRPAMLWGTRRVFRSVAAAEQLCLIGWRAVAAGGRVAALALTACGPFHARPAGRDRGMVAAIGTLLDAHRAALTRPEAAGPPLSDGVALAETLAPRGAEIWLASGFDAPGDGIGEALAGLARRTRPGLIRIADAFEQQRRPGRYRIALPDGRRMAARLGAASLTGAGATLISQLCTDLGLPLETVESTPDPLAAWGGAHG